MSKGIPLTIRPPWPDELGRVAKFLGLSKSRPGRLYPRIAVTGEPERIVAGAALQIKDDGIGLLHLSFRTRFCEAGLATLLLDGMETVGRDEGLRELFVVLPEGAPWRPFLESAGFVAQRTDEWWLIRRDALSNARLERAARLLRLPKITAGLTVAPLAPGDYPAVQAIAREHGLTNLERTGEAGVLGRVNEDYDPELSPVVRYEGEIAGVMLVKNMGDRVFVHIRAVAKKHAARSNAINAHFMACFGQPQYRHVNRCLFSAQPTVEKETIAMARRFGAQKVGGYSRYRKWLGPLT